jgi:MGT family glycosyltransferase
MTTSPRRFLLTMWEGGGTVPPELGVARRLLERGHAVHVMGDPTIAERAEAIGCGFSPWRRAPHRTTLDPADDLLRDWEVKNPLAMLRNARDRFMAGPAAEFAADTLEAIEAVRPDAVVADSMILGSIVGAQAAGLPTAVVMPNIWMLPTPGVTAVGPGFQPARTVLGRTRDAALRAAVNRVFDGGREALNAARTRYGLPPIDALLDQVLGVERILVLSSATFDFAAPAVPSNVRYVGPILDDPPWADHWTAPWPDRADEPLVLVGFSSTFQDQAPLLGRVVEALSSLPVRAVVTLGQMLDDDAVQSSDNVAVVRSAPHSQVLARASLAVTHCGHGTTLKALAAGVPLVCVPMGRDQNDTAARVTHHGAGLRLPMKATTGRIRSAVEQVLRDDGYRVAARRLAAAIDHEQRESSVVAEVEAVVDLSPPGPRDVQRLS